MMHATSCISLIQPRNQRGIQCCNGMTMASWSEFSCFMSTVDYGIYRQGKVGGVSCVMDCCLVKSKTS